MKTMYTPDQLREIAALASAPDSKINYAGRPAKGAAHWKNATVGKFFRPIKVQKTLRLDADVVESFESVGKGYQTLINTALRLLVDGNAELLEQIRELTQHSKFRTVAELVRAAEEHRPETRPYLRARARAIVLNFHLYPSMAPIAKLLTQELSENPEWWRDLERFTADSVRFPKAVKAAEKKIAALGASKSGRRPQA